MSAHESRCYSFPPIAKPSAEILILGSMPGLESLRQQQYYAHPRNAFWSIMQSLFAIEKSRPYQQRCELLTQQRVAVWDVLKACERSLEANNMAIIAQGQLRDTLVRCRCFGLQLSQLDIRQDSDRHAQVLGELTEYLGLGDYCQWDEQGK